MTYRSIDGDWPLTVPFLLEMVINTYRYANKTPFVDSYYDAAMQEFGFIPGPNKQWQRGFAEGMDRTMRPGAISDPDFNVGYNMGARVLRELEKGSRLRNYDFAERA